MECWDKSLMFVYTKNMDLTSIYWPSELDGLPVWLFTEDRAKIVRTSELLVIFSEYRAVFTVLEWQDPSLILQD